MNNFSRATSALVLTASLLAGSVAAFGQTSTTKSTDQAQKSQTQTDTKSTEAKPADDAKATEAKTEQKAPPVVAKSNKPLSTNENPDMIGKRNINTGIIAKMSGSTE